MTTTVNRPASAPVVAGLRDRIPRRPISPERIAAGITLVAILALAVAALGEIDISLPDMLASWGNAERFFARVGGLAFPPAGELALHLPPVVDEAGHEHHRARRPDLAEDLAVHRRDGVDDVVVGDEVARTNDVLRTAAELGERAERDLPAATGLRGRVETDVAVGVDRGGARDGDVLADADSAGEPHAALVRRP